MKDYSSISLYHEKPWYSSILFMLSTSRLYRSFWTNGEKSIPKLIRNPLNCNTMQVKMDVVAFAPFRTRYFASYSRNIYKWFVFLRTKLADGAMLISIYLHFSSTFHRYRFIPRTRKTICPPLIPFSMRKQALIFNFL